MEAGCFSVAFPMHLPRLTRTPGTGSCWIKQGNERVCFREQASQVLAKPKEILHS